MRLQTPTLLIATAIIGYASFCAYLYFNQEKLIFRTDLAPKEVNLHPKIKQTFIDGIEVGIIDNKSAVTIFYFGGNANNALEFLNNFIDTPYNFVAMNYPGYGNSKGSPSQDAIFEAATKVYEKFRSKTNILIGRSLGTGVAAFLASRFQVAGIILITPYYSLEHLARLKYPYCPIGFLIKHPFRTYVYIKNTDIPVCIIQAAKDDMTPPATLNKLLPFIKNLKLRQEIPSSTHADILSHPQTIYMLKKCIKSFVDEQEPRA
ncbi:alpha/beta hydrolase [Nitratiruptor sp. YY09-18]|uniref:alpha/beta hydrolase n=1 Tax=Nitratiruptor sp. YY09-18 TaxID=2724901 RepID=UPI0019168705|nr:alpha/beta hydrolase [Nitratiruptor sp. YY09-18]BCD67715.1 hypothetical protein NitYY0918_C0616 [Nitratiruptor sp. YY09-18]